VIAFLRGRLLEKHPNRLILDVQGVGCGARAALDVLRRGRAGADVSVRVHTHVREDFALFGFATAMELDSSG
jgi:Holliday junction resolvasome RuvABC DNA-binding subunit